MTFKGSRLQNGNKKSFCYYLCVVILHIFKVSALKYPYIRKVRDSGSLDSHISFDLLLPLANKKGGRGGNNFSAKIKLSVVSECSVF